MKILVFLLLALLYGCGSGGGSSSSPPPPDDPGEPTGDDWKDSVLPILQYHCADCHAGAGFLQSKETFLRSAAPKRVENRSMPPKNSPKYSAWDDDVRQKILDYVNENS